MMMNVITIDSRLTTPVTYQSTKGGVPMSTFSVANNQGQHTNFFDVVAYNGTADYARKYCHKSQKVGITGKMLHYIKPNGKQYYSIKAVQLDPNRDTNGRKFKVSSTVKNQPKRNMKDVLKDVDDTFNRMPKNRQ